MDERGPVLCGGGIVARLRAKSVDIAFLQEQGEGMFALPKGHVERGESVQQAAEREVGEETGITGLMCLGEIATTTRWAWRGHEVKRIHWFLFRAANEHIGVGGIWFSLDRLPNMRWADERAMLAAHRGRIEQLLLRRKRRYP